MKTSSLWLALCLCVASVAQADVTMTMETTSRDGHTETRQLFLGQDRLSMDGVLIYRGIWASCGFSTGTPTTRSRRKRWR